MSLWINQKYDLFYLKVKWTNVSPLDDKGIIAYNIEIYYRPIPKIKHKQTSEDIKTNSKVNLFTNTM